LKAVACKWAGFTSSCPSSPQTDCDEYFHDASSGGEIFRKNAKYLSQDPTLVGKLSNVMFILVN